MPTMGQTVQKSNGTVSAGVTPLPDDSGYSDGAWKVLGMFTHQFSVKEYALLAEAGILHEDDRLELIEGRIVDMAPIGSSHASRVKRTLNTFVTLFHSRAIVSVQDPVLLDDHSEPQPDLMLLQSRDDFYAESHPTPEDVLLLVEVADTSLEYDQQVKIPLYAKSGIQEVWLVNLRDDCVEVYRLPASDGYQAILVLRGLQQITPLVFPDVALTVAHLLGRTNVARQNKESA